MLHLQPQLPAGRRGSHQWNAATNFGAEREAGSSKGSETEQESPESWRKAQLTRAGPYRRTTGCQPKEALFCVRVVIKA